MGISVMRAAKVTADTILAIIVCPGTRRNLKLSSARQSSDGTQFEASRIDAIIWARTTPTNNVPGAYIIYILIYTLIDKTALSSGTLAEYQPWPDRVQYPPADETLENLTIRSATDALVYRTFDHRYIITSPNASYIPKLKIGHAQVLVTEDAKLGIFDPILHPQICARDSLFLAAIPRPPSDISPTHRLHMVWHLITHGDVDAVQGMSDVVLKKQLRQSLSAAADELLTQCRRAPSPIQQSSIVRRFTNSLSDGLLRLARPAPFRNLIQHVAYVQRSWLLLKGYLTYFVDLHTSSGDTLSLNDPVPRALPLVGAFTNNIDIVEILQRIRIPVWFLRFENQIHSTDLFGFDKLEETPGWWVRSDFGLFGLLAFKGTLGPEYLQWYASGWSHHYSDIDTNPLVLGRGPELNVPCIPHVTSISGSSSSVLVDRSRHHGGKDVRGKKLVSQPMSKTHFAARTKPAQEGVAGPMMHRSVFDDPVLLIPLHPPRKASWQLAMMACDVQRSHPAVPWKYWCPDPATLMRGEPLRQRSIFLRWLRIRGDWIHHLDQSTFVIDTPTVDPLRSQSWRDLLMSTSASQESTTRSSKRRQEIVDGMARVLPVQSLLDSEDGRWWRQHIIYTPGDIQDHELCEMAWEMAELNFRMELLHLDATLCSPEVKQRESEVERRRLAADIHPDKSPVIPTVPDSQCGLMSEQVRARAPYLEAFRCMMLRWRSCPDSIKYATPLINKAPEHYIEDMESRMVLYYVQVFWETTGRAPQIPLRLPVRKLD
ncbi:hypothetical protein QCA50_018567 [Cerrena zonata]|uniref:Uncharacterized protein n=1 Tax=Cerrena zonata TaxID=2478898 RepID=A0AAW0FD16_9APHY